MNIWQNNLNRIVLLCCIFLGSLHPVFGLDFDSVDYSSSRKHYSSESAKPAPAVNPQQKPTVDQPQPKPTTELKPNPVSEQIVETQKETPHYEKLPNVPKLPDKAFSNSVAPINTMYTGKVPDKNALIPCNNIKVENLILDKHYQQKYVLVEPPKQKVSSNEKQQVRSIFRYRQLPKGTQFRVVNTSKISDYMACGQKITFKSTQSLKTPYFTIPANTKFTGVIEDVHRPQMTCNGGLVAIRFTNAEINGYNQTIDAKIVKVNTQNIHLGNLKGTHTYLKTTCKKAKWGQTKFQKWSKTSSKLASKGPAIIVAPFPYLAGALVACASTVTSPITALLGKGGSLTVPANTVFTIKLNQDAKIRY